MTPSFNLAPQTAPGRTVSVGEPFAFSPANAPADPFPRGRQATLTTAGAAPLVEMVLAAHYYRENGCLPIWAVTT